MLNIWKRNLATECLAARRPAAGAAGKIDILKIIQTLSYDTSMEGRDQFEHFGDKIVQKYQSLAKVKLFQCMPLVSAPFLQTPEMTSGFILYFPSHFMDVSIYRMGTIRDFRSVK